VDAAEGAGDDPLFVRMAMAEKELLRFDRETPLHRSSASVFSSTRPACSARFRYIPATSFS